MNKICIGSGSRPIEGFLNFDLFTDQNTIYAPANSIPQCSNNSVDLIFTNAVFEHFSPFDYSSIFSEWNRLLSHNGYIVSLGIPYFDLIIRYYLSSILTIDQVYNYLAGEISYVSSSEHLYSQIHKTLFNKKKISQILNQYSYNYDVFNYCYPQENYPLNLGFIASSKQSIDTNDVLKSIPGINSYITISTIDRTTYVY